MQEKCLFVTLADQMSDKSGFGVSAMISVIFRFVWKIYL